MYVSRYIIVIKYHLYNLLSNENNLRMRGALLLTIASHSTFKLKLYFYNNLLFVGIHAHTHTQKEC